ncbi:hypothetical protein [Planomicrobium okeanokoites]|uniref:hypothetical protein n=1 Tax=Planomicrobium okeanokoites TaxID=244 RepID=UPI000A003B02|nr:hypothetical protein [Planomicrobium okeanokoites]
MKKSLLLSALLMLAACGNEETQPVEGKADTESSITYTEEDEKLIAEAVETEAVEEKEGINLRPGIYTFGQGLDVGRYLIKANSGEEGLVAFEDSRGFLKKGEMFRPGMEFVIVAGEDYTLETEIELLLIPLK